MLTNAEQMVEVECSRSILQRGHAGVGMYDSAAIQAVTDLVYTFNNFAPSLACHALINVATGFVARSLESYNTSS